MEFPIHDIDFLTNEFLTECLQQEEGKQNIVVTNFSTSPAVSFGTNFQSIILMVELEYMNGPGDDELQHMSLIVKSELTAEMFKEMTKALSLTEPVFYNTFLSEASKFTDISFVPKHFFCSKPTVTVLEDLKEVGFVMADKAKLLDFEHCLLYVEAAATLHAVAFAVHKTNPELVESIGKEKLVDNPDPMLGMMVASGFQFLAGLTEKIEERFSKFSTIFRDCSENLMEMLGEALKPNEVLNTLTQGDPWIPNMMFKYNDEGVATDIKLIDFQLLRYGSPVSDLVYFTWTSVNHEVRRNRLEELYKTYLHSLNSKLREFNCSESLSYEDFMKQVMKLSPFTILLVGVSVPMNLNTAPIDPSMMMTNPEKMFKRMYNETFCANYLPKLLEDLELTGVYDYMKNYKKQI